MRRFPLLFLAVIVALSYSAIVFAHPLIFFDPAYEAPYMDCVFNLSSGQCLTGNWTVNSSELEAVNYNSSGSWCGNRSYFSFDGVDSISYDVPGLQNLSNFSIAIGFTPNNVTKFAGIVSMFSEDILGGGWTLRTLDDGYLQFRHANATNDTSHTFNDNGHTGLVNNENYTLVLTLDGTYLHAWLNNVQIERQTLSYPITLNASAKLRLGYYNSTSVNRFTGQIHFVYIYNYSLTPHQAANRTKVICGSDLHPLNGSRVAIWPLTNNTGPDWSNLSSNDQLRDGYDYRTFSDHDSGIDFHRGIDFSNLSGIPEVAVMNGTVVRVETDEENNHTGRQRFGNWVMIEHTPDPDTGQPRHTLYFHMNNTFPLVSVGQNVTAGTLIGYTGRTGLGINTNHLHFELARDLDEDRYSQRRVIHPLHILNYTNINATNIHITANTTHYIVAVTQNYTDMDFVALKIVGTRANRSIHYETREGLNSSDADQHCYLDLCVEPGPTTNPFVNFTNNFTITRDFSGPLIGAIIKDTQNMDQIYEINAWPEPNAALNLTGISFAQSNEFILYNITLGITGDAAYNITLSLNYPANARFNSSSRTPVTGTNSTFIIGNVSPTEFVRFNITLQALNVTNGTLVNTTANITYYNFTGFSHVGNASNATVLLNAQFSNATLTKTDTRDPIDSDSLETYQIRINVTNGTLFNTTLYDNYSDSVHFRNATPSPTTGNNTYALGNLSAGTVYQVNITVQVKNVSNGLVFNNTANLSFANATGMVTTMNVTINTTVNNGPIYNTTNLTIDKSDGVDPINISTVLNYTINLTSTGTGTAHNITLNETYPPEVRFVSSVPSPISGTNTSFLIPNLTSGSVYSINISVLTLNTTGTINNTANVSFVNETGHRLNYSDNEQTVIENMVTAEPSPGGSSGGGGGSSGYVPPIARPLCVENWFCSDWTTCTGEQSRECLDLNGCGTVKSKPDDLQTCTVEVKEEPARVFAPFTLTFAPRQFFYAGKALILTFLMVMSIIVLHSPGLFTFARDPLGAYVRQARANGLKDNAIRLKLKKAGWKEYAIEEKLK